MSITTVVDRLHKAFNRGAGGDTTSVDKNSLINDERFIDQLHQIEILKGFLFEEKVEFKADQMDSIDLGALNGLRFHIKGRPPSHEEWSLLDQKLSSLASYLDPNLRRKIRIRELGIYFGRFPLVFLVVAVMTTIFYPTYPLLFERGSLWFNLSYLLTIVAWTIAQGGLGACAFLLTQALTHKASVQKIEDVIQSEVAESTLDLTDRNILRIRILLGSLFSFLIGLPVSYPAMNNVYQSLFSDTYTISASDLSLTLVPFLLGFSTSLVLAILNRCVGAIQTLFGFSSPTR